MSMSKPKICWYCRDFLTPPQYRWFALDERRRRPVHRGCLPKAKEISGIFGIEDRDVLYQCLTFSTTSLEDTPNPP